MARRACRLRHTFTDTVDHDFRIAEIDLCLLAAQGSGIECLSLIHRGDVVATLKRRVRFTDLTSLDEPLSFEQLAVEMPRHLVRHIEERRWRGGVVPPATWESLVAALKHLRPGSANAIARLEELVRDPRPRLRGRGAEILAFERDAIALAMMTARIDRSDLLTWQPSDAIAPFLRGLQLKSPIEDRLIDYDASVFGSWRLIARDVAGVAVFEEGGNHLTVINVNRSDVEHALGVDLVYYNHRYKSFVLVQYKRMRREAGRNVYRPDETLEAELERMRLLPVSHDPSEEPADYRLHPGSCYLKLCPDSQFRPREGELIRGMYLPLDYWDELSAAGAFAGVRRGLAVTFEAAERHVNSSLFADLVRDGWIGSRTDSTALLEAVVEELLKAGHSVTLAEYKKTRENDRDRP